MLTVWNHRAIVIAGSDLPIRWMMTETAAGGRRAEAGSGPSGVWPAAAAAWRRIAATRPPPPSPHRARRHPQEGFNPATFKSSRSQRGAAVQQSVADFLDEDELQEHNKQALQVAADYDTFGDAAAAAARAQADAAAGERAGLLPDLLPAELLAPVADGIGAQRQLPPGWARR
jgi:hypothetical protein